MTHELITTIGYHNLATSETYRSIQISTDSGTNTVSGNNRLVDGAVERVEAGGGSFILIESCVVTVPENPYPRPPEILGPRELGHKVITKDHFTQIGVHRSPAGILMKNLVALGVKTYGDVLSLGKDEIVSQSATVAYGEIKGKLLGYLAAVVEVQTPFSLPNHRATPDEQLLYFDDIRQASMAIGLPYGGYKNLISTGLMEYELRTIRHVSGLTSAQFAKKVPRNQDVRSLYDFVSSLRTRVVAPFEQARLHRVTQ